MRRRKLLPGQLRAYWGIADDDRDPDIVIARGDGCAKADGHLLWLVLSASLRLPSDPGRSFLEELKLRGYDITTLEFRIKKFPLKDPDHAK